MKKKCSTCLHYQQSPVAGQGWCRNPILRKPHERSLVGANELACDKKFYDFWQPIRRGAAGANQLSSASATSALDVASILGVQNPRQALVYLSVVAAIIVLLAVNVVIAARTGATVDTSSGGATKSTPVAAPAPKTTAVGSVATPVPTPIPPSPTPFQQYKVAIANTNREGLKIRQTPGGEAVVALPEGTELIVIGPDQKLDGKVWKNVKDPKGNVGWVLEEYVQRKQ